MSADTAAGSGAGDAQSDGTAQHEATALSDATAQHETGEGTGNSVPGSVGGGVVQAGTIRGDVHLHSVGSSTPVPRQLPLGAARFVNRAVEQDALTTLLAGAHPDDVLLLSTIDGTAGVGKSSLAVHWARRVRDRFPDGDLHVNLRGFDPVAEPMSPVDALGGFLSALGVSADQMPSTLDERAAMFRSRTHGKRMLVLLDDAADSEQVLPLLPASGTCLVLVTSRNRLDALVSDHAAARIGLRLLDERESHDLLTHHLGEDRMAAEPVAAAELVEHCAGLPLALGIAAVRVAEFDDFTLAELVAELRDERERLDGLDAGGRTGVRAVLSLSYHSLSAEAAQLFRLLGLPTGPDIALDAVAALAGSTKRAVRRPLSELLRANLLDQHDGRYRFHDLLRSYAAECAAADELEPDRTEALRRLLDFYLRTSAAADRTTMGDARHFDPDRPASEVEGLRFDESADALVWWEGERNNLVAASRQAANTGFLEHAWQLPSSMMYLFHARGYADQWVDVHHAAIEAAQRIGDPLALAHLHHELGVAHYDLQDFEAAAHAAREALTHFDETEDLVGKGLQFTELAQALIDAGRPEEAVEPLEQALGVEGIASTFVPGIAHNALGRVHAKAQRLEEARSHFDSALRLNREFGDVIAEGFVLYNLSDVYRCEGDLDQAVRTSEESIEVRRRCGHRSGEGASLRALAGLHARRGDVAAARRSLESALVIFEGLASAEADEVRHELSWLN